MLNTPIVADAFGIRLAGTVDHEGGWVDQPAADLKNINSQNIADFRLQALWEPSPGLAINLTQVIHRAAFTPDIGEDPIGVFTQSFNLTTTPNVEKNYGISNLAVTYDFAAAQLLSSTTYVKTSVEQRDWGYLLDLGGAVFDVYDPIYKVNDQNLNQELRLSSRSNAPLQWTLGGYIRHAQDEFVPPTAYYFGFPGPLPAAPYPFTSNNWSRSYSFFADASYEFLQRFTLGAGVRYFNDYQTYETGGGTDQNGRWTSTDPRFYLRYRASDNLNLYASASKGFRSGGFNAEGQPPYNPESVWTYELGTKARTPDGRFTIDTAVFVTDYTNLVVTGFTPADPVNLFQNAGAARMKGVEADMRWTPIDQWNLGLNGDYLNARITDVSALGTGLAPGDLIGDIPRYQVTASVQHDFRWDERPVFARIDYSQTAPKVEGGPQTGYTFTDYIYILNFKSSIQVNPNLRLGLFAQNLLNNRGVLGGLATEHLSERPRPRTFGLDFGVSFD